MTVSPVSQNVEHSVYIRGKKHSRENVDNFLKMDDIQLALIAKNRALKDYNKRHRNTVALFLSTPLIAGASAAILSKGNTRFLAKEVSGRAAKLAAGIKGATWWTVALGSLAAVNAGVILGNKSDKVANFREKHGLLSFMADFTAMGVLSTLVYTAGSMFTNRLKPETVQKIAKKVGTSADYINGIKLPKFLQSAKDTVAKHFPDALKPSNLVKSSPNWLKTSGKRLVSWAPYITLASAFFKSCSDVGNVVLDSNKNFISLKNKQDRLAELRNKELSPLEL